MMSGGSRVRAYSIFNNKTLYCILLIRQVLIRLHRVVHSLDHRRPITIDCIIYIPPFSQYPAVVGSHVVGSPGMFSQPSPSSSPSFGAQ